MHPPGLGVVFGAFRRCSRTLTYLPKAVWLHSSAAWQRACGTAGRSSGSVRTHVGLVSDASPSFKVLKWSYVASLILFQFPPIRVHFVSEFQSFQMCFHRLLCCVCWSTSVSYSYPSVPNLIHIHHPPYLYHFNTSPIPYFAASIYLLTTFLLIYLRLWLSLLSLLLEITNTLSK